MKKILIIEDDDILRAMLTRFLRKSGYSVDSTEDGAAGLNMVGSNSYDLIVTDIIMPGKEGIETIQEIRRGGCNMPVIAISGGGRMGPDSYLPLAKMLGADATLGKPFKNDEFLKCVKNLLGEDA